MFAKNIWKNNSLFPSFLLHCVCAPFDSFSSVQFSRSVVSDSATPWTAARQVSLSITNYRGLLKLMPIESVMPSGHLILYHPLLLLPPILPCIRVFSNELTLRMRVPSFLVYCVCAQFDSLVVSNSLLPYVLVSCQAALSMGFSREYWSGSPNPPPGDLLHPGIKPLSLISVALAGRFFTIQATWEALLAHYPSLIFLSSL